MVPEKMWQLNELEKNVVSAPVNGPQKNYIAATKSKKKLN
jgi:hypothetical protein